MVDGTLNFIIIIIDYCLRKYEFMTCIIAVVVSKEVVVLLLLGICMSEIDSEVTPRTSCSHGLVDYIGLYVLETLWGSSANVEL